MADKKVSQLTSLSTPAGEDLLLVVDNPSGTPVSKSISLNTLANNIPSNTSIAGTLTVAANATFNAVRVSNTHMVIGTTTTIASNNASTQLGLDGMQGSIFWDANYLYVAVSNTVIKRVALSIWDS